MPTIRITSPSTEPITLADARTQCRIAADDTSEDALLQVYIQAAREAAEQELRRSIINTTWEQLLDAFPANGCIVLDRSLAASVTSVVYLNAAGQSITLDPAAYQLRQSSQVSWLIPASGASWPATLTGINVINVVRVRYVCGYGAAPSSVPAGIRQWLLLTVAALYAQRESVDASGRVRELPARFVDRLLDAERIYA